MNSQSHVLSDISNTFLNSDDDDESDDDDDKNGNAVSSLNFSSPRNNYDIEKCQKDTYGCESFMSGTPSTSFAAQESLPSPSSINNNSNIWSFKSNEPAPRGVANSLGEMLRKELKGRHFFNFHDSSMDTTKPRQRIVSKKGVVNINKSRMSSKRTRRYVSDFFNTMLDIKWRYVLLIFTLSFFLSWLSFASVWYAIAYFHGDLEPSNLPEQQAASRWEPCVSAIYSFASCFLFSIETQHTIGYGSRKTNEICPQAIIVMSLQSVVGVMIQACMVGTIFAKLSRPKKRAQTFLFSKNAVICLRDGCLCLMFRIGNMCYSHLVEAHIRAILVSKRVTEEGEVIPYYQTELKIGCDIDGEESEIFFIWPITVVHRITSDSPFYCMSKKDFLNKRFEVLVVLEGIVEPTGMSIQARSSYLPSEIKWGYRFTNVLHYRHLTREYKIDYSLFDSIYKISTCPKSSRHQHAEKKREKNQEPLSAQSTTSSTFSLFKVKHSHYASLPCFPQLCMVSKNHEIIPINDAARVQQYN